MVEGRGEIELYNQWFQIADLDRDGVLSGQEAVQFFMRSGLPQNPTLFKVWQYVAGDRPALSRQEFYTSMKLVSLAQSNAGILDDQQAMKVVNGLAGLIPPPHMSGLSSMAAPPASAPIPPSRPPPAPTTTLPFQPPSALGQPPPFPPLSPDKAAAYQTAFEQLDTDKDGLVQGVDCFSAFMRSGLPKTTLKEVWDVVAGDVGQLNRHQFVQCLYLIDCSKMGIPIPTVLPPGQFPPVYSGIGLDTMVDRAGVPDIYSSGPLQVPPMPQQASFVPGATPAIAFQSQVPPPPPPNRLTGLSQAEISRLDSERQAALQQEAERKKAEEERLAFSARREFYTQSLADLRVAQSKVSRTLVEAQQRAEMERSEADAMEAQYNKAYETFSAEHARVGPMLQALQAIEEEKAALTAKSAALKTAVSQLENYDPEWETREKGECESLRKEITELTVKHEVLQKATGAIAARRADLEASISGLRTAIQSAEKHIDGLEKEVKGLTAEAKADGASVSALLRRLAPLYNELYTAAKQAMVPLPPEALATIVKPPPTAFEYDALRFGGVGVADWENFESDGYVVTAALPPDPRLKSLTSPGLEAAVEESQNNEVAVGDEDEDCNQDDDDGDKVVDGDDVDGGEKKEEEVGEEANGGDNSEEQEKKEEVEAVAVVENDTSGGVEGEETTPAAPAQEETTATDTNADTVAVVTSEEERTTDVAAAEDGNKETDDVVAVEAEVVENDDDGDVAVEEAAAEKVVEEKDPFGDVFGSVVAQEKARKKSGGLSPTSS